MSKTLNVQPWHEVADRAMAIIERTQVVAHTIDIERYIADGVIIKPIGSTIISTYIIKALMQEFEICFLDTDGLVLGDK